MSKPERCSVDQLKDSEKDEDLTTSGNNRTNNSLIFSIANWPNIRPHKSKTGRIKRGTAGQICGRILADFEQNEGPKKIYCVPPLILFNSREVLEILFSHSHDKKSIFFLIPNSLKLKKWKLLEEIFFLSGRPICSSGLAENFCKEFATLLVLFFRI